MTSDAAVGNFTERSRLANAATSNLVNPVRFGGLICRLFGHRYLHRERLSALADRVTCVRCRGDWAMAHELRYMIPYPTVRGIYEASPADEGQS
jgi:hypothetical protein